MRSITSNLWHGLNCRNASGAHQGRRNCREVSDYLLSATGGREMTKDEIIEMARQAGFETMFHKGRIHGFERDGDYTEELEDFAKLVEDAAFKRWAAQTKLVVQDEREACAKVCDDFEFQDDSAGTLDAVSKAIRART